MNPKVTVITPTFNRADYIEQTINSVLLQTLVDFEYLILDDGSIDETPDIIKKYLSDSRVKYYWHENQGEADTVNWGWSLASGEYFVQVNSDDTVLPSLFEDMVNVLDNTPSAVLAYPDFYFIDENAHILSENRSRDWNIYSALSAFSCYAASPGTFIRRSAFKSWTRIKRNRFNHINDIEMYWDMALVGKFLHVPKTLATWRTHNRQISIDRYKSIPEIVEWYHYYFSKQDLPSKVKRIQSIVRDSIDKYCLHLLKDAPISSMERIKMKANYRKRLGIDQLAYHNVQFSDTDLIGNKFNGHDLHIYLNKRNVDSVQLVVRKESEDTKTFSIKLESQNAKPYYNSPFLINKFFLNSDIIHLHLIHNTPFDIRDLPIITKIKPCIITLHDPYFFGAHCIYHFECNKWNNHCYHCTYTRKEESYLPAQDSVAFEVKKLSIQASNISAIVASRWMEDFARKSPIWSGKPIYRVPFGVDQQIFNVNTSIETRKKLGISSTAIVLMFRQDASPFKGLDVIISALENVTPHKDTILITVGQRGRLETLKEKYSILEFDWIKDDYKLAELYQTCDLFLMPSRQEAFGMMAIEAMSCGKPVLALDGTALPEVIDAPRCGIAVTESEYAGELQRLLDHPGELRDRGCRSLDFARKEYNSEVYIDRILDVYRDVMERHKLDDLGRHMLEELLVSSRKLERSIPSAENPGHQWGSRISWKVLRGLKKRVPKSWKQVIKRMLGR